MQISSSSSLLSSHRAPDPMPDELPPQIPDPEPDDDPVPPDHNPE
ncbi:MAG: hypothetical protein V4805_15255 [Pseudomonadota bacterium]